MSQFNKTSPGNNPTGKVPTSEKRIKLGEEAVDRARKQRRTAIIITSVVIVLILIIVGVSYYFREDARYKRLTIITVDDISINMDYFLMKTRLAGAEPVTMLETLTNELLIKIEAPRYVAEVTPEDIDQALRRIASGESETISESEFKEWYRQLLNEIGLSDSEYKEIVATSLLATRLREYLAERIPTVQEQVHLHSILLDTEDTEKIWDKYGEGEEFDKVTREVWQDKQSEGTVEDVGWLPRGVLPPGFDEVAFNLIIDDISEPLIYVSDPTSEETFYYLLMVSEKADAREIDEAPLQTLKAKALDAWLLVEIKLPKHKIGWHGLKNGFDSETNFWINWQLAKQ